MSNSKIKVETIVSANIDTVWNFWVKPEHIIHWNFPSKDWHCPKATNNLKVGGKYFTRMEARDGSAGFDLEAVYNKITSYEQLAYTITDGRQVVINFERIDKFNTKVTLLFEPENINGKKMQQEGWQAILTNFKKYVEKKQS